MTVATLLLLAGVAQAPVPPPDGAEYPYSDMRLWRLEQQGRLKRDTLRRLADSADSPEAVRLLMQENRVDDALAMARRIAGTDSPRIAEALRALSTSQLRDGSRDYSDRLRDIVAAGRAALPKLPREDAAALAFALVPLETFLNPGDRDAWRNRHAALIQEYAGTAAAFAVQIDQLSFPIKDHLDTLDAIVRDHPGSALAARALYAKGSYLTMNDPVPGVNRHRDPTDRFFEVLAIEKELESGRYPQDGWAKRGRPLLSEFYAYQPEYAPGNVDRTLTAYAEYIRTHFALDPLEPLGNGIGYVVTRKMADLFKLKNDPDGVDRTLRALERESADPAAARYLRAMHVMRPEPDTSEAERTARNLRGAELLTALAAQGDGLYSRKGLATLASAAIERRDFVKARELYRDYLRRYPGSPYAWVAALRVGEAEEGLAEWTTAEHAYEQVTRTYATVPLAVMLGHALAARAWEGSNQPERALAEYDATLAAWDLALGLECSLYTTFRERTIPPASASAPVFRKPELTARVETLRASLTQPGGALLERGRFLLVNADRDGAAVVLGDFLDRFPRSSLAGEARQLLHRARLEKALDLGNPERSDADVPAAAAALDALAREPFDRSVSAAKIARASLMSISGRPEADAAMTEALKEWLAAQSLREPATDLERDVVAIRRAVFLPLGGGIYGGPGGWNAFTWPAALPPYLIVNPQVPVLLADGALTSVSISAAMPGIPNVLYADPEQISLVKLIIVSLGGTRRRELTQIMETPNQPVGQSMNILSLWNRFFPSRPGHWGGWEIESYPSVARIEFLDAARTRAAARVTIGYSGATVVLERQGTVWKAVRLTNFWVT
jgi:Tetratricopeptide repeat